MSEERNLQNSSLNERILDAKVRKEKSELTPSGTHGKSAELIKSYPLHKNFDDDAVTYSFAKSL